MLWENCVCVDAGPESLGFAGSGCVTGCASWVLGLESRALQLGTETLTSLGAAWAKAVVSTDVVGNSCEYWEAYSRVSGVWWVGMSHGMSLLGLGCREQSSPTSNPDTSLSRGSLSKLFLGKGKPASIR